MRLATVTTTHAAALNHAEGVIVGARCYVASVVRYYIRFHPDKDTMLRNFGRHYAAF